MYIIHKLNNQKILQISQMKVLHNTISSHIEYQVLQNIASKNIGRLRTNKHPEY